MTDKLTKNQLKMIEDREYFILVLADFIREASTKDIHIEFKFTHKEIFNDCDLPVLLIPDTEHILVKIKKASLPFPKMQIKRNEHHKKQAKENAKIFLEELDSKEG